MNRMRLILWVLGVFLLGAAVGGMSVYEYQRRAMRPFMEGGPKEVSRAIADKLARELSLDASQRPAFDAVMAEVHEEIKAVRREARPRIEAILEKAKPQIMALLRPEQKEKFLALEAKRRERAKRGDLPPGGMPPPGPPR